MRANLIHYTWKFNSGYCYAYVMITYRWGLEEIKNSGRDIVLWGGKPEAWGARSALEKAGLQISCACDVTQPNNMKSGIISIRNYRELLKEEGKYFFIIYIQDWFEMMEAAKLIQYAGIDEFGIVFDGFTKDFHGKEKLQKAFYDSIFEVFGNISLINHWDELVNIKRAALEGAGYWDVPYELIYRQFKNRRGTRYLEVGPGVGIMSLSLKKLIDVEVEWINIPAEEKLWGEWRRESNLRLLKQYGIKTTEGYIEIDEFHGEYDVIVLAQVMEHFIFNPVNTFQKLRELLAEDGYLFVSVPEEIKHFNVECYSEMPYPQDLSEEERNRRTSINGFGHYQEYSYDEAMKVFEESELVCVAHQFTDPIHHFMLKRG